MAKGTAMGLWKGKKGSSVFYRIKNSNNAQKQGIRERVYDPANPRTSSQAGQRMKLLPAQRVYGMLKPIIERSWQGIPYGNTARYEFLRLALSESTTIWPALDKNSSETVPGGYQISKGTLQSFNARINEAGALETNIRGEVNFDDTLADFYTQILQLNSGIKEGDQITFVICRSDEDGQGLYWEWRSLYVNTSAEGNVGDIAFNFFPGIRFTNTEAGVVLSSDNPTIYAGAVILSRDADTPLRSTERLSVDVAALPDYFSASGRAAARASYMNPERRYERDWPVEQSDEETEDLFETTYTISGLTGNLAAFNGSQVKVWADADNTPKVVAVREDNGVAAAGATTATTGLCVCDINNSVIKKSITVGDVTSSLGLIYTADPALASLRTQIVTESGPMEQPGQGAAIIEDQP